MRGPVPAECAGLQMIGARDAKKETGLEDEYHRREEPENATQGASRSPDGRGSRGTVCSQTLTTGQWDWRMME